MHVLLKFVSLVWMQRRQQSYETHIRQHYFRNSIGVVVLKQPVVQRLADGFLLVVQIVDIA